MHAYIIVDLGFGDAGKGLLTDFLARNIGAGAVLVVRYNGGAQAGHNVLTPESRQHTFAQFGAATFLPEARTFLSRYVVIHPAALLNEGDLLQRQGVIDAYARLRISEQALVITPYHQGANRIRELVRGKERHGSCGVGVGEAVEDALTHPEDRVVAGDLLDPAVLRRKLRRIREWKWEQVALLCREIPAGSRLEREYSLFENEEVIETWIGSIARINELELVVSDDVLGGWLNETETVLFEGAQGVLLDAEAGFHPYTTWSNCTTENALRLVDEMAPGAEVTRIGVLRTHMVRHGPGPLPTETEALRPVLHENNREGEWQGGVRYGWFDAQLARYALRVNGGVDCLALTHLDMAERLGYWQYSPGYKNFTSLNNTRVELTQKYGVLTDFQVVKNVTLDERMRITQALLAVSPVLETCEKNEDILLAKVDELLGQPVDIVARGPRAGDVQILHPHSLS